jgi:hypothetical protein
MSHVPRTKVLAKKSRYALLVQQMIELKETMTTIRREMRDLVTAEVQKNIGDKIAMIDGALTETILQKEVLIEKGLMTREEINVKYKELRERQGQGTEKNVN